MSSKRKRTPPGIRRTSWTRSARRKDAVAQRQAWRNKMVTVPRDKLGFPQSMKATLRYSTSADFALTSNMAVAHQLRANDLFDPQYALGGHQPRSFDEYMKLYSTFTVLSSKIMINWVYEGYDGPSTIASGAYDFLTKKFGYDSSTLDVPALPGVICGLHKGIEVVAVGEAEKQMEKDRTQWKVMTPQSGSPTITGTLKPSDFFGKDALTGSEGYTGSVTASPTREVYWELWAARASNDYIPSASVCKVKAYISIDYQAVFTDPKTLAAS